MHKIALIFPRCKYPTGDMPMGIGYIASALLKTGKVEIDIIDTTFIKEPMKYIAEAFTKKRYDLIGFSVLTSMTRDAGEMADIIKGIDPGARIIFGGPHATVAPELALEHASVDAICIGEGEQTMMALAEADLNFTDIAGIWYKQDGQIVKNPSRKPIDNLDELDFPNKDLLDTERYFKEWFQLDSVSPSLHGNNIIASRGCPYHCTYCQPTLSRIFGKKIRKRSPENIVAELQFLKDRYQIKAFMFQDDTLIVDKKWVYRLCDLMLENNINLLWGCNIRANLADKDLFKKMISAGLRKVNIGIESGSQRILDEVYDKRITLAQVENAINILKELDLKVQGYFMIGAPTETEAEILQTIKFAKNLDIEEATFSITTPLPYTHLFEKSKDMIGRNYDTFDYYKEPVYSNKNGGILPPGKISLLKKRAFLEFYLAPKRLLSTMKALLSAKTYVKLQRF